MSWSHGRPASQGSPLARITPAPPNKSLQRTSPQVGAIEGGTLLASIIELERAGHRARPLSSRSLGRTQEAPIRAYRYIYYRIYSWNLRAWGEHDFPQYNVCLVLAFLSLINGLSLLLLLGFWSLSKPAALGVLATSLLAHYQYFVRSGRYLDLKREFAAQPLFTAPVGLLLVWGYVAGSLALFFGQLYARSLQGAA